MGVAGEVIQRLKFSEDRDIDRRAKGVFEFVEGSNLGAHEQRTQFVGAVGEGSHNVIVPVDIERPIRNYNKSGSASATGWDGRKAMPTQLLGYLTLSEPRRSEG